MANDITKGMKFKAAPDSETPDTIITVVNVGMKDDNGLSAVELEFPDGSREIAAVAVLQQALEMDGLTIC